MSEWLPKGRNSVQRLTNFSLELTPAEWASYVQAEGQLYFHEPHRHFVTEANIRKPGNNNRISRWMRHVEKRAEALQIQITPSTEIMLQLDQDDEDSCGYYMIEPAS